MAEKCKKWISRMPVIGIVCGSGLGTLAEALENRVDLTFVKRWNSQLVLLVRACFSTTVRIVGNV